MGTAVKFAGRTYSIPRGVFDPEHHLSGLLVAKYLTEQVHEWAGRSVLEVGTGCGILAGALYDSGADVTATDISKTAVNAAVANLSATNVEVRCGDGFEPVAGRRFDAIVVNPPYETGRSLRPLYRSAHLLDVLAAQWRTYADELVLAFPTDDQETLRDVGFELDLDERLSSPGRELGIFRSRGERRVDP